MTAKYFLDTNIFVYSFDTRAPKKVKRAQALIHAAITQRSGCISSQVVQEFINVATRKFAHPMSASECREYLSAVLTPLCEIFPSVALYEFALQIMEESKYHYYDALIVAAAIRGGCNILYSEDLQHGRLIHGVTIRNPFAE